MTDIDTLTDGRSARRVGSRRKLLIAGLRLIEKGNYRPSLTEVTDKAGMHPRSLHSIFGTMPDYLNELAIEHETSIRDVIAADVKDNGASLVKLVLTGKRK